MKNILAQPAAAAMRQLFRRFIGREEAGTGGNAAVEFALIVPALVLMMVATADFGMGFYRKMQVYDAAQAGAQWAMANGYQSPGTSIKNAVTNATSFSGIAATPDPCPYCGCTASPSVTTDVCPGPITIAGITKTTDGAFSCTLRCPDGTVAGTYVAVTAQATYTTMLAYPGIPASFPFRADTTVRIQ